MKRLVAVIVVAALVVAASASVVIAQQSPAAKRETLAQALKGAEAGGDPAETRLAQERAVRRGQKDVSGARRERS